jgi:hypothetical protein
LQPWQQARILYLLLTESRRDLSSLLCAHFERITLFLLTTLSAEKVLTVFLAVRRARANHKHTVRAILSYLLQHSDIETLARSQPRTIRDCFEHALGKAQARYFGYHAPRRGQEAPLPTLLRRYGGSEASIRRLVALLYFGESERAGQMSFVSAQEAKRELPAAEILVPWLRQLYQVGTTPDLIRSLEAAIVGLASALPELPGRIAVILDASASMRGRARQEFAPIALAVAFERVLQLKCADPRSYQIGGFGWPPAPEGPTDFGRALVDALEAQPDLIVLLTDGYENLNHGDAARILATLQALGISTPILCFRIETDSRKRPRAGSSENALPALPLRNERDFGVALEILDLLTAPRAARERALNRLLARQATWETEVYAWIAAS